jgi:Putative Zn-dependent protease, contains TPR repeats
LDRADKLKALELTSKLILKDRNNIDLQLMHATIISCMGKNEDALKEANLILQKTPNNYMVYDLITSIYRKNKQYQKAFPCYEKMMAISPGNIPQLQNYIAEAYIASGRQELALPILNKLIAIYPYDYDLYITRAGIYLDSKNYDKAKSDLDKIISKDSINYKYYQLRAQLFLKSGNKRMALSDFNKALSLISIEYDNNHEDVTLLFTRAEMLNMLGSLSDAVSDYNMILNFFPFNYEALKQKSRLLLSLKMWDNANATYKILIQNYPGEEEFYNNTAMAYINLGDYNQALENLNSTVQLNPYNCDALFNRSKLYKAMGRNEEAKSDIKQIIKILSEKKINKQITSNEIELLDILKHQQ